MALISPPTRWTIALFAVIMLTCAYLFQRINVFHFATNLLGFQTDIDHPFLAFIVNKTIRLVFNDFASLLLIITIFQEKKYVLIAFYVFLFEVIILLPIYFVIKLSTEGVSEISSPLLSQIHRMIVNPTLMIVLMISFFYQRYKN